MKFIKVFLITILLSGCAIGEAEKKQAELFLRNGQCDQAERLIKNEFPLGGYVYWWMGRIERDCRNNRALAVRYFQLSHQNGTPWAAEELIRMGAEIPKIERQVQRVQTAPQQIIIQQQPMSNPNACIQDGGGIFCPNYRR